MKKASKVRLCAAVIAAVLLTAAAPVYAAESVVILVCGGGLSGETVTGEMIDGAVYVSVTEFAAAMGAGNTVRAGNSVSVAARWLNITATGGDSYIVANGNYLYVPSGCRAVGGEIMVPLYTIARAYGANITWSNVFRAAVVSRGASPIAAPRYSRDDVYWMARIIHAEAMGESFEGMIAVGNVVMNRVASPLFPDTVHGVIFDRRGGVSQFTPAANGGIYNNPSGSCIAAAHIALSGGADIVGESLFFSSVARCWASRNREHFGEVGNHKFFL